MTQPIIHHRPPATPALNCARTDDHPAHIWDGEPMTARTPQFWCDPADPLADRRLSRRAARQVASDEQVNTCAAKYFRPMPDNSLYASFAGLVEGVVTDKALTDEQRIAEIRTGLAALDLVIAEKRALVVPHGPVRPPYGSPERVTADNAEQVAR
ncbi:hypothetical protein Ait01nite_031670 [Actinoplanes italicus]|uniref:Uncharacterized protein n=1 Tax=Actinoplanes italicus TaxID=113567 RepID=A0A2T0KJB2_9ACTN|nr:hypothetical protein [Actinoplanes italicus]PRX23622.1 hypothetical protein CLV67_103371 [Actinoplanes italicus]GIE30122.1 hypothetical protein Ait01nite_031670 [Actinoplanes italicus]